MKILMISPLCPLPLEKGGAVRIWNIAKQLSKHHTVDLVCFIRQESERIYEESLKKVFNSVTFILRKGLFERTALSGGVFAPLRFAFSNSLLLRDTLFSPEPLLAHLYQSEEMKSFLLEKDRSGEYDLFYAETFYSITCIKEDLDNLQTKLLLIEQNIESAAYKRQAEKQTNPILRGLMLHDVGKIQKIERDFWQHVHMVGGLSQIDVEEIGKFVEKDVLIVENGVDIDWFTENVSERISNEILFVGSLSYFQNIDALRWLLEDVWPQILKKIQESSLDGDFKLRIVGRGADSMLKKYVHEKGHSIDESVDDIRNALQHATVLIAPLRAGSGTKYKVLEAMASHLPVVTTSVGAEGLRVRSESELIISDTSVAIANDIVRLLGDVSLRDQLAENGYRFVSEQYDWTQIVRNFQDKLIQI